MEEAAQPIAQTSLVTVAGIASPQMISAPDFPSDPCRCAPCSPYRWLISPMFLVVWGIVGANYLPYVVWVPHASVGSWLAVGIFHVLLALLLASYLMTVFTDPGTVPPQWHEAVAADDRLSTTHRYCERSGLYRPLRSHYCSVTGRVVLNMDHFCPWVVNTVGFYNRKFFVLFLFYTLLTCGWVLVTFVPTLFDVRGLLAPANASTRRHGGFGAFAPHHGSPPSPHPIAQLGWDAGRFMVLMMALMLDVTLVLMLLCFFPFHAAMVCKNETTIEGTSPQFDVGFYRNVRSVLGADARFWLLPVYAGGPLGDGVHWPVRMRRHSATRYDSEGDAAGGMEGGQVGSAESRLLQAEATKYAYSSEDE